MDIRNFCIIAHIDHGKSTLADRLIEYTGTLPKRRMREQVLDTMELERERGITIKLQPIRMHWKGTELNLIDTPGHTDFRYEVGRSLAACEGAILLVDASQGIQAQTLATLSSAREQRLAVVAVLNKVDLPIADPEGVAVELSKLLSIDTTSILRVSAKEGWGIEPLLDAILTRIPGPAVALAKAGPSPSRALIFDAAFDTYRGGIAYVRVTEGKLRKGEKAHLLATKVPFIIQEVGHFAPELQSDPELSAGQIGYIVTGLKDVKELRTGDTVASSPTSLPLPGYRSVQPVIFAALYPADPDDFELLRESLVKLSLSDAALTFEPERNATLGMGFRCGFLGMLHLDIVRERLEREHGLSVLTTAPTVLIEVRLSSKKLFREIRPALRKGGSDDTITISNPADFPDPSSILEIGEPWVELSILARQEDTGKVLQLVTSRRGMSKGVAYLEGGRVHLQGEIPLMSIVVDFFDTLKSLTSGYGSMSYEPVGFRPADLVKLQVLLLGEPVEALSTILHRSEADARGRAVCKRLKEVLPKEQFPVPIQAAVGGRVLARETLPALRKDVTGYLYGGDVTRKRKLLEKQKEGKKRLRKFGKVRLTQDVFLSLLKSEE